MNNDENTLKVLENLIKEVKKELAARKVLMENKTPEKVFSSHEKNMKQYIAKNVYEALKIAEK